MAVALFAVMCAIAVALAVTDQFAIFGIDRGVGAVGTSRAPVGQSVVPAPPSTITGEDPASGVTLQAGRPLAQRSIAQPSVAQPSVSQPSVSQPSISQPTPRTQPAPSGVTRHRRLDD
jgi:hypothetical protein